MVVFLFIYVFFSVSVFGFTPLPLNTGVSEKQPFFNSDIIPVGGRVDLAIKGLNLIKGAVTKGNAAKSSIAVPKSKVRIERRPGLSNQAPPKATVNKRRYRNVDGSMSKPMTPAQRKAALARRKVRGAVSDQAKKAKKVTPSRISKEILNAGDMKKVGAAATGIYILGKGVEGASEGIASVVTEKVIDGAVGSDSRKTSNKKK